MWCSRRNFSFVYLNFTGVCLNFKEIIPKGTIAWSTMEKQTNETKEVYLCVTWKVASVGLFAIGVHGSVKLGLYIRPYCDPRRHWKRPRPSRTDTQSGDNLSELAWAWVSGFSGRVETRKKYYKRNILSSFSVSIWEGLISFLFSFSLPYPTTIK